MDSYPLYKLELSLLPMPVAVCRLDPGAAIPDWAVAGGFFSITRTLDELSIVCEERFVLPETRKETGWRVIKVEGPLDFSLTGIMAGLSGALAQAGISLFAVSTFDTDYILVKDKDLPAALDALRRAGCALRPA